MLEERVVTRANGACEMCGQPQELQLHTVSAAATEDTDTVFLACDTCRSQMSSGDITDVNHWHCLNDAIWSPVMGVQAEAYRMLTRLSGEPWAQDLLDIVYLDDGVRNLAEAGLADASRAPTLDNNGTPLQAGDTVHLIKDLPVKGATFNAKRGTAVRNIGLTDNPAQIEGRVNGTRIVITAAYTKKS
ncbi:PhnA domain-containing protein [Alteromonas sp. ASW11-19]|uniref:PhnA domain-containing protein n=1 Tax=Alteromonas salexigens TaxID=2982530 RepID=A0ABT2VMN9_9ALTE|nr:alkylphosphonate utilization protein [Alteromonas salexigens]MCU7554583.1 PhnA domain-containing protein [Alteromonas salexigens]